ncbi:MAG: helix-turn-helix domain-containing protein [archaeon]
MNTNVLTDIGLSPNEIKVYLALLKLGKTSSTNLIKETSIVSSALYYSLENLIKKSLASYTIISNKKHFQATEPKRIIDLLETRKKEVENLLPELEALQKTNEEQIETNIYEGYKGIKGIYDELLRTLKKGDTYYVIGARQLGDKTHLEVNLMIQNFHKHREEKGINVEIIFNKDVEKKIREQIKNFKYMKAKFSNIKTNSVILLFNNKVINFLFTDKLLATETKSKEAYESYKQYFKEMWKD